MKKVFFKNSTVFFLMIGIVFFSIGSFAEDRLSVISQALDQYDDASRADEASSQERLKIPFEFLLAQGTSGTRSGADPFPEFLLKEEKMPEELRRMLQHPESFLPEGSDPDLLAPEDVPLDPSEEGAPADGQDDPLPQASSSGWPGGVEDAVIDSLQLKDMDIIDVLKLLSQKSNLNIIAGRNVKGNVSIYLKDVKLKDALRIILDANDLAYKEDDGILRVMTAAEHEQRYGHVFGGKFQTKIIHLTYAKVQDISPFLEQIKSSSGKIVSDENSNTLVLMDTEDKLSMMVGILNKIDFPIDVEIFDLNYASAKEMADKITPVLTKNIGSVKYDERSNKLVVADVTGKIDEIRQVINAFDMQDGQVLIEARIVQIKLTDSLTLGVNWHAMFPGVDKLSALSDFDVLDNADPNRGQLKIAEFANFNYEATIEALKSVGDTNILSSPSVMAVNNQEAKILVGSTQPYVTTTVTTPASGPTTTAESVTFIDVGVKLYVTPTIHKDGFITMKIRPEVSSVLDTLQTSENNEIPIVETSEAETTVRIKDGTTIVIGGLIKDEKADSTSKVPLLGDIPLLGSAFRNRSKSTIKTEIAIFLTPRIVSGEEQYGLSSNLSSQNQ